MNILYIAPERRSAQAAASALHRLAQNVTVTWAQTPGAALGWLRDHRNTEAVIVDTEAQAARGNVFLEQVQKLGVATPIAVIAPEHLERLVAAVATSRDAILEQERHSRGIVEGRLNRICTALQERVLELEAIIHSADQSHAAQNAARETLEQRLAAAEASCRELDQKHGAEVAALTARLGDRDAQHQASLTRTNRICTVLQERLLELEATLQSADARHAADVATSERLAVRESELAAAVERGAALERQLTEQTAARSLSNERLAAAETARQRAEARYAMRLASLNTDLTGVKARHDAVVNQNAVAERHLRDTAAALDDARARIAELIATSERLASREADLDAALTHATAARTALERQLADAVASHQHAQHNWESTRRHADATHAQAVESLTTRLADVQAQYGRARGNIASVEQQLADAAAAHQQAQARWESEVAAAAEQLARREAELGAALAAEVAARNAVEQKLGDARTAHQHAQQQAAADLAAAAERQAHVEDRLKSEIDARAVHTALVERQLADAAAAHQQAHTHWESEVAAAAEQLARRETELGTALAVEIAARIAVEQKLDDAQAAHQHAQQQAAADLAVATEQHADLEDQLKRESAARRTLDDQVAAADRARQRAEADHARAVESLTTRLADLQVQHERALEHTASVERQLTDVVAAHERAHDQWESETAAAAEQFARRESEMATAIAAESAARIAVEQKLGDAWTAHQHAQQQAAADLAAAAERQADLDDRLKGEVAARTTLEDQLAAANHARQQADADHARTAESWTTQLAGLQVQYEQALEHTASVERHLTDAVTAHQRAQQQAAADLTAAAERHADLEHRRQREIAARTILEDQLAAAHRARQQAEGDHQQAVESLTTRLADLQAQQDRALEHTASIERQLTAAVAAHQHAHQQWESERAAATEQSVHREAELSMALAEEVAARIGVEHRLAGVESAHQHSQQRATADLAAAAERHANLEDRLVRASTAQATLEEQHAVELAELSGRLADLQAHHVATVTTVAEQSRDISRLQEETNGLRRQLNVMRTHAAGLRHEADRVSGLQLQIAESQKEIRRQFERAPYGLFECTREGAITRANNVLTRLLGYRASADLTREGVVPNVFECAADLQWLLERAQPQGNVQSIDTTLRTRDRRRLSVRLHALTSGRSVLIAVEDLTRLSALEHRVREAHRLEAVGRVASEVAVTCDTLLRDVTRGGQQWLAGFESDTSLRQQGELLLGDVTRAAGLLRQFAVYGHAQITNVEPVSMQRVLRDMKPVLERVLGDDIELTLPKTTHAFDVDVEASRVERILVNVANYARERMPQGGRVRIQLATTVIDQRFLASHPKVRPGAHVVITISEERGATRPTLPIQWPIADEHRRATLAAMEKPGMDLGPLMALIGGLGGHLWMSVEPAGNVTLQIHLPKRTQDEVMEPAARGPLATRGRQLAKWFRH